MLNQRVLGGMQRWQIQGMGSRDSKDHDWRPKITAIDDVVAEDVWSFHEGGVEKTSLVRIGRPVPIPNDDLGDWYCPVTAAGVIDGIKCVFGVGPVDALMNASNFISGQFKRFEAVTPGQFNKRPSSN